MFLQHPKTPQASEARLDLRTIVTGVLVPIGVGLIATQVDLRRALLIGGIAVVAMVIGLVPRLRERTRRWVARRADARLARVLMPTIRELFDRFGRLTYTDRNDNLHYVLTSGLGGSHSVFAQMKVTDQHLFHSWWYALNRRVQSSRATIDEAMAAVDELHTLINAYKRGCFDPVFDRPSTELLEVLDARVAVELESVRERFNSYLSRVEEVADRLSKQTTSAQPQIFFLERPKPLRAVVALK